MKNKRILVWIAAIAVVIAVIGTAIAVTNFGSENPGALCHADITLSNEQIEIWYTDEAANIGKYANDTVEPQAWGLFPSV